MFTKLLLLSQLLAFTWAQLVVPRYGAGPPPDSSVYSEEHALDSQSQWQHLPHHNAPKPPMATTKQPEIKPMDEATVKNPADGLETMDDALAQNNDSVVVSEITTPEPEPETTTVPPTTTTTTTSTTTTTTKKPHKHEPHPHPHPHPQLPQFYTHPESGQPASKPSSADHFPGYAPYPPFRHPYTPYPQQPNFHNYPHPHHYPGFGGGYGHHHQHHDTAGPKSEEEDHHKSSEEDDDSPKYFKPSFGYGPPPSFIPAGRPIFPSPPRSYGYGYGR